MIQHPVWLAVCLIGIEVSVLVVSSRKPFKHYFDFLPPVFWIYFLPMLLSTLGVIPAASDLYQQISVYGLPAALFLLLIGVNLPAILQLGPRALALMLAGSAGVMIGAPLVLTLFQPWLPSDAWMGFGSLSGSWIGGSANMIAVKEAIQAPEAVFLPMVAVDVVVAYSWLGILISLRGHQKTYDRWNHSDTGFLDQLHQKISASSIPAFQGFSVSGAVVIVIAAAVGAGLAIRGAALVPPVAGFSSATWIILFASILGVILSFTPLRRLESRGASKIGYWILYLVLTSIGAKANLAAIVSAPILILAGFAWVMIHAFVLMVAGRLLRVPMALVATASQANIGGPVSAPIVAAVYEPALAPVGLLLGILGNIMGTYLGLLCSQLCHLAAKI